MPAFPREAPIRILGQILLTLILTALVAVAGWAGLNAWTAPAVRYAGEVPTVQLPEEVVFAPPRYPRRGPRVIEAAVRLSSGAVRAEGTVDLHVVGQRTPDGPDRVAVLDGATGATLATAEVPARTPADIVLERVPVGRHAVVAFRSGESPRWRYSTRVEFELEAGVAPNTPHVPIELDVSVSRAVVILEAVELPANRPWTTVTGSLARPDDPKWSVLLPTGPPPVFEPGQSNVVLEFGSLGAGRYELRLTGFEADTPTSFDAPLDRTLFIEGRPR